MNRKTLVILSVSGAMSLTIALSTVSMAMARSSRSIEKELGQSVVSTSPDDHHRPNDRKRTLPVSGTLKSLTATAIVVTDSAGNDVTMTVNGETLFTVKGSPDKTVAQLLAGQKVTVFQDSDGIAKMVISGETPKPPEFRPGVGPTGPGPGWPRIGQRGPGGGIGRPGIGPGGLFGPVPGRSAHVSFGTVAQISDTSVTITLMRPVGDKTTETYAINSETKVMPLVQPKVAVGDTVLIVGDTAQGSTGLIAKSILRAPSFRKPAPS